MSWISKPMATWWCTTGGFHTGLFGRRGRTDSRSPVRTCRPTGNFVIYGFPEAIWSTETGGDKNAFLVLQDDGSLVIYDWAEAVRWASGLMRLRL